MNGDDHPATRAGLLALLARHLPPGLMIALDGPPPEGLLRHFPQARLATLPDAMDDGAPAPIDLLLHPEDTALGDTQPAL
ncbi:hypothetical protein, partial [Rhodovarius sp.]|uniref:hypothetical protein n=1 Tax=Rhodovarius sp. TaxID=2972673 RepID=UPI003342B68B